MVLTYDPNDVRRTSSSSSSSSPNYNNDRENDENANNGNRIPVTLSSPSPSSSSSSSSSSGMRYSIGDHVDVLDSAGFWCEAEVAKIDQNERKIFVTYLYWESSWDEWISDIDIRVAPLHTHTYTQGGELKVGQRIEALDQTQAWLEAYVIDVSDDQVKVHYKGWHVKFDEWLAKNGPRIRPYGRHKLTVQKKAHQKLWKVPGTQSSGTATLISNSKMSSDQNLQHQRQQQNYHQQQQQQHQQQHHSLHHHQLQQQDQRRTQQMLSSSSVSQLQQQHEQQQQYPETLMDSEDEHERRIVERSDRYSHYISALTAQRLKVVPIVGDGNCLFRSVAHQVYGDNELHGLVRQRCMDYMEADAGFFSQFVEGGMETFPLYLRAKRLNACWGDDPEIQAICELYNRPAEIWAYDTHWGARKLRTFHEAAGRSSGAGGAQNPQRPLRLSYYGGGHYDSIVDDGHSETVLKTAPGEAERLALQRVAERLNASLAAETSNNALLRAADADDTALDLAIQISRREREQDMERDISKYYDLETCLAMSLAESYSQLNSRRRNHKEGEDAGSADKCQKLCGSGDEKESSGPEGMAMEMGMGSGSGGSSSGSGGAEEKSGEPLSGSMLKATEPVRGADGGSSSGSGWGGRSVGVGGAARLDDNAALAAATEDAIAMQSDIIQTLQDSEQEYLQMVVLSSLAAEEESRVMEEQLLEAAKQQSLEGNAVNIGGAMDVSLDGADAQMGGVDPDLELALKLSELTEDEALQLALSQSMESEFAGYTSSSSLPSSSSSANALKET